MTESAKVTIINQRRGKLVLGPDPEELKAFDALPESKRLAKNRPQNREVPSGSSIEVTAAEAEKLLNHKGIVDAAKVAPSLGEEQSKLKARIAELEAENAKLRKDGASELGDGDAVLMAEGQKGVIKSIKGKKAKVELESGEVVDVKLADLKPAE